MNLKRKEPISNNWKQDLSKGYLWCVFEDLAGLYRYKCHCSEQDLGPIVSIYGYFSTEDNAIAIVRYLNNKFLPKRELVKEAHYFESKYDTNEFREAK